MLIIFLALPQQLLVFIAVLPYFQCIVPQQLIQPLKIRVVFVAVGLLRVVAQHPVADVVSEGPDDVAVEFGQFYYYFAALLVIGVVLINAAYFESLYFLFGVEMNFLLPLLEIPVLIEQF